MKPNTNICYTKRSKICASFAITKSKCLCYFKANYVANSKTKKAVRFNCSLRETDSTTSLNFYAIYKKFHHFLLFQLIPYQNQNLYY